MTRHGQAAGLFSNRTRADDLNIPTDIAGLDTTQGLRRVVGNKALYLSLLKKFAAGQKSVTDEDSQALGQEILGSGGAPRAHAEEGVSGNIGACRIQGPAAAVEAAIKERKPNTDIDALLASLGSARRFGVSS